MISRALAFFELIMKLACLVETSASPILLPFKPDMSIYSAAETLPFGFRKLRYYGFWQQGLEQVREAISQYSEEQKKKVIAIVLAARQLTDENKEPSKWTSKFTIYQANGFGGATDVIATDVATGAPAIRTVPFDVACAAVGDLVEVNSSDAQNKTNSSNNQSTRDF